MDMDKDGKVDVNDLQAVMTALGERRGDGRFNLADLTNRTRNNLMSALGWHSHGVPVLQSHAHDYALLLCT